MVNRLEKKQAVLTTLDCSTHRKAVPFSISHVCSEIRIQLPVF